MTLYDKYNLAYFIMVADFHLTKSDHLFHIEVLRKYKVKGNTYYIHIIFHTHPLTWHSTQTHRRKTFFDIFSARNYWSKIYSVQKGWAQHLAGKWVWLLIKIVNLWLIKILVPMHGKMQTEVLYKTLAQCIRCKKKT